MVILADQLTVLPSTLPFSSGPEPCAACWVPVRRGAIGGEVQGGLLRAHGRIDDDFPLAVHGHADSP